jgi:ankyrin repeat protein
MYSEDVAEFLASLSELPDFAGVDLSDVNACATDGDNALHVAVRYGDLRIAKGLIEAGIEVSQPGDLGYTPLHVACLEGNVEMVKLLVDAGADLFALNEGYPPFTVARLAKHDHICDLLGPSMTQRQTDDPKIWIRARIKQLQRELARLEAQLRN